MDEEKRAEWFLWLVVAAVVVVLALVVLTQPAEASDGEAVSCVRPFVGRWVFYNLYTIQDRGATLYGGWKRRTRHANRCRPVQAIYCGVVETFYPVIGTRPQLYVNAREIKWR